jgi:DNA-directed RNA polymerase specialized sigma24 family protein
MDPQQLTLAGLAHRCTQETALFFQHQAYDPRYCFELFRRAIAGGDECAWSLLYAQYRPLVAGWVKRHPAFPTCGEECDYLVNRAFEKVWAALTPARFGQFPDLKALLRYLQMCVHSVVVDQVRAAEGAALGAPLEVPAEASAAPDLTAADQALPRLRQQEFWRQVEARLKGEQERRVVYGSFVLGLKPRELCAHYPDIFADVAEVYRVKENVLDRLRRDDALRSVLEDA